MNLLVAYDIADPGRLRRIARIMEDYGLRVQKSIFEVQISLNGLAQLRRCAEEVMDLAEDGVKYYPLCRSCDEVWLAVGTGADGLPVDGPWVLL
jgi:CRISPR-associated protein Cas2